MTGGELAVVLEQHGRRVKSKRAGGWMAQCPAHADGKHLSLSISHGREGRYLLHCFAGCSFDEIRCALNLPAKAFFGWQSYKRCGSSGIPSLTSIIRGVSVLNGIAALRAAAEGRLDVSGVTLTVPARSGHVTRAVAGDMAMLFGAANNAGHADLPIAYSARWAGRRLGIDHSSVSRAVRSLTAHGSIVVDRTIPVVGKRPLRLYRLPKAEAA